MFSYSNRVSKSDLRSFGLGVVLVTTGLATLGLAQTTVNLTSQARNFDFSQAVATKPMKTGSILPVTCSVGEFFFKTNEPDGKNTFACTATGIWKLQSGNSGMPSPAGEVDKVLISDGVNSLWTSVGGDLTGSVDALVVKGIQGHEVSGTLPAPNDVLKWDNQQTRWVPAPNIPSLQGVLGISVLGSTLSTDPLTVPNYFTGNGAPATNCTAGKDLYVDLFAGKLYFCKGTNSWAETSGSGGGIASLNSSSASVQNFALGTSGLSPNWATSNGTHTLHVPLASATGVTAGLVSKADYDVFAAKLNATRAVQTSAPLSGGGALTADLTLTCPTCETTTRRAQASGYASLDPGAKVPVGQLGTGAASASVFLRGDRAWSAVSWSDISGTPVTFAPSAHVHSATDISSGTLNSGVLPAAGGDVSGTLSNATVTRIQGRSVDSSAPANGQTLVWSDANSRWQPATPASGGGSKSYMLSFGLASAGIAAGANQYVGPQGVAASGAVTARPIAVPITGTLTGYAVAIGSAQPATGALTCTAFHNGANTGSAFVLPAGLAAGSGQAESSWTIPVTAGDRITFQCLNEASTASSIFWGSLTVAY